MDIKLHGARVFIKTNKNMKMKKNIVFIIGLLFAISYAKADFKSIINIKLQNNANQELSAYSCGAQTGASDGVDKTLGELDLPPMPLMPGILGAMFDMDTLHTDGTFSYIDIRSVPENTDYFIHQYLFNVYFGGGDTLDIIWGKLPGNIDSAIIQDYAYDMTKLIRVDMKKQQKIVVGNSFVNKFTIKIWYNKLNSVVEESPKPDEILLFPNPGNGVINVNSAVDYNKYEIYATTGELISADSFNGKYINIPNLSSGVYIVKLFGSATSTKVARFVNLTK